MRKEFSADADMAPTSTSLEPVRHIVPGNLPTHSGVPTVSIPADLQQRNTDGALALIADILKAGSSLTGAFLRTCGITTWMDSRL